VKLVHGHKILSIASSGTGSEPKVQASSNFFRCTAVSDMELTGDNKASEK
jgi:hypothetical protein